MIFFIFIALLNVFEVVNVVTDVVPELLATQFYTLIPCLFLLGIWGTSQKSCKFIGFSAISMMKR